MESDNQWIIGLVASVMMIGVAVAFFMMSWILIIVTVGVK